MCLACLLYLFHIQMKLCYHIFKRFISRFTVATYKIANDKIVAQLV